jgi:ABC-type glycerol-3-phosphate transport system substrate-binding protein
MIARRAGLALLLLLLTMAGALAGCGGGDTDKKNAYVDEVNAAQQSFATTFEQLSTRITSSSTPTQDKRTLQGFQKAIDKTTAQLQGVEPPGSVKQLHQQLIDEISSYGAAITKFEDALGGDVVQLSKAQATLATKTSQTSADINRTIERINQKLRE